MSVRREDTMGTGGGSSAGVNRVYKVTTPGRKPGDDKKSSARMAKRKGEQKRLNSDAKTYKPGTVGGGMGDYEVPR